MSLGDALRRFQRYSERIECLMLPVVEDFGAFLATGLAILPTVLDATDLWRRSTEAAAMGQPLDVQMRIARIAACARSRGDGCRLWSTIQAGMSQGRWPVDDQVDPVASILLRAFDDQ
jgi:hypothetical protein